MCTRFRWPRSARWATSAGMPTVVRSGRVIAGRVVHLGVDVHRHPELRRLEGAGHLVGGGEGEHPGEVVLGDEFQRLLDRARIRHVERHEVEHVARLPSGGARSFRDAARADLRDLVRERADPVGPSRLQAAGGEVRPIPELVECAHDLLAGLGPDALEALQEATDRLVGDTRGLRDVVDGGRLRRRRVARPGFGRMRVDGHPSPLRSVAGIFDSAWSRIRHKAELVLDKTMLSATFWCGRNVVENMITRR